MPKKKGWGQPKGSQAQNCQEGVHSNLNSYINPSNTIEVGRGCEQVEDAVVPNKNGRERPRESRGQYCQENSDSKDIYSNPSNRMEVGPGCKEEQEADIIVKPKRKGRGKTRGLTLQMKRQQSADGKLDVLIHPTKLVAVGPGRNGFITDLSLIVR
ncbi:hypothetical protein E2542_SST17216 [Spatholobus suberectus]|nr:hypothetical protein E2542_SST17216 [Spatholobus suberectus]